MNLVKGVFWTVILFILLIGTWIARAGIFANIKNRVKMSDTDILCFCSVVVTWPLCLPMLAWYWLSLLLIDIYDLLPDDEPSNTRSEADERLWKRLHPGSDLHDGGK